MDKVQLCFTQEELAFLLNAIGDLDPARADCGYERYREILRVLRNRLRAAQRKKWREDSK